MGTYSSIYIEFKQRGSQRWRLLEGFVPMDFRNGAYDGETSSPDSNHLVSVGGTRICRMFSIVRQGVVRDLLAGYDTPFNDRGFPDDLSPELKALFDQVQQQIESDKDSGLMGRDWRWGKSWCYLSELEAYLDERLERCKSDILTEHTKLLSCGISHKLDAILAAVTGGGAKGSGVSLPPNEAVCEDSDQGEMLEYHLTEELNEIIWLKEFVAGIALIHEFLTDDWLSESSIRLVFYAS